MNVKDLVERLAEIADAYPNAEVMLATQPSYPLAETLRGVADPDDEAGEDEDEPVVWLVSGGSPSRQDASPYAPRWVFEAA